MRVPDHIVLFGTNKDWRRLFRATAKASQSERKSLYAAYLQSAAWRAKRALAENQHGIICVECRVAAAENIHHKTYSRIGDEDVADLVPLCRRCHEAQHGMATPFWEEVCRA